MENNGEQDYSKKTKKEKKNCCCAVMFLIGSWEPIHFMITHSPSQFALLLEYYYNKENQSFQSPFSSSKLTPPMSSPCNPSVGWSMIEFCLLYFLLEP